MIEAILTTIAILACFNIVFLIVLLRRNSLAAITKLAARFDAFERSQEKTERVVKDEISASRQEAAEAARHQREEASKSMKDFTDSTIKQMSEIATLQKNQLEAFATRLTHISRSSDEKLDQMRGIIEAKLKNVQDESGKKLDQIRTESGVNAKQNRDELTASLKAFKETLDKLILSNEKKHDSLKTSVENKLTELREDNSKKLDEMRKTVDEKLQGTLDKRLGESFKQVSERLELVHKGLGEMQTLANGVGDLKKMMTNVKTRGTWGEIQLGSLLEQILSPDQYEQNVQTKNGSLARVEFAIKLPGKDDQEGPVWLPVDAKFPQEDYQRLVEAQERADADGVLTAVKQLENSIKVSAKDISEKYLNPPKTTDFAIMFLPTEGLYAEVIRRTGLVEAIQRQYRVIVAGPTTLAALLNSLQMGFRTLAIQKRSSEVWEVLGAVKTEFGKFGGIIQKVQKKLHEASNVVDQAASKSRTIERKLRRVQELPSPDAQKLLSVGDDIEQDIPPDEERIAFDESRPIESNP